MIAIIDNGKLLINKRTFLYLVLISLYRIMLDIVYDTIVSRHFRYYGYNNNPSVYTWIISWMILLVFASLFRKFFVNPDGLCSSEILFVIFIVCFVPFTSLLSHGQFEGIFIIFNCIYWTFLLVGNKYISRIKHKRHTGIRIFGIASDKAVMIIGIVFSFSIFLISIRYANFRLAFSFSDVYSLRFEAREFEVPGILNYVYAFSRYALPLVVAFEMRKKNYALVALYTFAQFLGFGIDGSKSSLIMIVLVIVINCFERLSFKHFNKLMLVGLSGLLLLSLIIYKTTGNYSIVSTLFRRVFYMPSQLSQYYFDFFSHNPPDFFRASFLRFFGFQTQYPNLAYIIGEQYFGRGYMDANNGLIADALANFGYVGVIIMPLILNCVLRLIDICSEGLDNRIWFSAVLSCGFTLINSFIVPVLISHGLLAIMILLIIMNRDTDVTKRLKKKKNNIMIQLSETNNT